MAILNYFQRALWIQLFFSFSVTILIYSLSIFGTPVDTMTIDMFQENKGPNVEDVGDEISGNFEDQLNVPLVDLGSLIFFSGNIIIDLILNFITALPNMVNLLISAFFMFVPVESVLQNQIKVLIVVSLTIMYTLGAIIFLANLRSGRALA